MSFTEGFFWRAGGVVLRLLGIFLHGRQREWLCSRQWEAGAFWFALVPVLHNPSLSGNTGREGNAYVDD